jgi:hypothetical protein
VIGDVTVGLGMVKRGWAELWSQADARAQIPGSHPRPGSKITSRAHVLSAGPKLTSEGQKPLRLRRDLWLTLIELG